MFKDKRSFTCEQFRQSIYEAPLQKPESDIKKAIPYYRVSTERQGISGLGLEAQKKAVTDFAAANGFTFGEEYVEVESGRNNKRPILQQALASCKKQRAILLIARLDRLARNVAFVSKLMESGVDFKAVDNPHASKLVVHIMAAFAEHARDQISANTRDALKAAKQRGVELGSFGRKVLSKRNKHNAKAFALSIRPIIENIQSTGKVTIREITDELNRLQISTYRNKDNRWHLATVHNIIKKNTLEADISSESET